MKIEPKHVSSEEFKKYGKAVILPKGEPTGRGMTYKYWSQVAEYGIKGETEIGIYSVVSTEEKEVSELERHLNTPEVLIPIDASFVLPVLKDGEDDGKMEAFTVNIGDAVILNDGVWHAACMPIDRLESSYFVISRKDTSLIDVEKKKVKSVRIDY